MKQQHIEVIAYGVPDLSESEARAFYTVLLAQIVEQYRRQKLKDEPKQS